MADVGLPVMSTRLVSTLRTWRTTPFGTALTFMVFGTVNRPSSAAPSLSASLSTCIAIVLRAEPRWSPTW